MKRLLLLILIVVVILFFYINGLEGLHDDLPLDSLWRNEEPLAPSAEKKQTLKILSYNAGLAHGYVSYGQSRISPIIEAIKTQNPDILCLQEVWTDKDQRLFFEELKSHYSFVAVAKRHQRIAAQRPVCAFNDLWGAQGFVSCKFEKCMKGDDSEKSLCMRTQCSTPWQRIAKEKPECAQAISAQSGVSAPLAIYRLWNPFSSTGLFIYKGSLGIMLFSKIPFNEPPDFLDMEELSTTTHRGALLAKLRIAEGRELIVGCTHLTALLGDVPYSGPFGSWQAENQKQVEHLIQTVEKRYPAKPYLLMGDYNCSFGNSERNIDGEAEPSCQKMLAAGFSDPLSQNDPQCTFCGQENKLISDKHNTLIDHIFIKNLQPSLEVQSILHRIFAEEVSIKDEEGKPITTPLSDHFGVGLILNVP